MSHDFSTDTVELTPTLKIRRKVVSERYADVLDGLYANGSAAVAAAP